MGPSPELLIEHHQRACRGFTDVVREVPADQWAAATPCGEWDARALVEHVIGFHEFLLLRPLGVRAQRPGEGPAARWLATEAAIERALADPGLRTPIGYFDGRTRRPGDVLAAITSDVLIHTWDLARAVGVPERLDDELSALALDGARAAGPEDESGLFAPAVPVASDATTQQQLLGLRGRDPTWRPPTVVRP